MKRFLLLGLFILSSSLFAQTSDTSFIHHTFHSEVFGKERKISVHRPAEYIRNPETPMMVAYFLDAQGPYFFSQAAGIMDYLSSRYSIIPTLVVGIHSDSRFKEFTPSQQNLKPGQNPFDSQLEKLQTHLSEEVFPWIASQFNILPYRVLVGHSRGGLFVVQTLFNGQEDMFDGYIAIIALPWDMTVSKA